MELQYYLTSIIGHLDPKRALNKKYVSKIISKFSDKRAASVLKSRNFNTTLLCSTTLDEIYAGLVEKYTVQSDLHKAEEVKRLYDKITAIDFDLFMKSGETKYKILYLLHCLSAGSSSYILKKDIENEDDQTVLPSDDDAFNATVCLVNWQEVLFAGEEFEIRKFDVDDAADTSWDEENAIDQTSAVKVEENSDIDELGSNTPAVSSVPAGEVLHRQTLHESLSLLADQCNVSHASFDLAVERSTEFFICNRITCVMSGACLVEKDDVSNSCQLNHLSRGALHSAVFHLSESLLPSINRIQLLHKQVSCFSDQCDHLTDISMACGKFIEFLTETVNACSKSLQPVTLLNLDALSTDLHGLINLFGAALQPLADRISANETLSPTLKTQELVNFSLSTQTHLHSALLCCDASSASWLLLLWCSTVRTLLRAAIQTTFKDGCDKNMFAWFDTSVFARDMCLGSLNLSAVNNVLTTTHRYLMLLCQCREESGDFLTHAKLFMLPMLFDELLVDILKSYELHPNSVSIRRYLSPIVPSNHPYNLPTDIVDLISCRWMTALQSECKKASLQLYSIWETSGLHSWLLALRLVFFCQSVLQFDSKNKFVKKSTPALDLLALHLPQDVWLEFVPAHIRAAMFENCDAPDVSATTALDAEALSESYSNCKTVTEALELMESSSNERYPLVLFPVSLVLCPEVLSKYVRVHSFLSAFHVSKNWLSRSLFHADPQSSCYGKYAAVRSLPRSSKSAHSQSLLTPADRLLWLLRSAVFFALSALQQYFFTSVVCANCHRLSKELESVNSADDLERIHNEVLSAIVSGCLFPVGHRTYQASLRHLIVLADSLSRQQVAPKNSTKHVAFMPKHSTQLTNLTLTQCSDDASLNVTQFNCETSWKLLATDTYQGIRFLADTLSRSASKSHSVNRSSLNSSLFDSEFASSSVAWLATELQHASDIVSKQSKALLQLMHAK